MSFSRINTNVQSMQAFTSLNNTSSELGMRRERLSTGKRINAAEDDSAGYSIAKKLEAKTRGQGQALKNIGDAKGMLTVAEGGLNSSMDILQTMKEKTVQASNDSLGDSEREAIQGQLDALASEIGDTLGGAEFNGTSLFDGAETLDDGGTGQQLSFQVGASSADTFGVGVNKLDETSLGEVDDGTGNMVANDLTTIDVQTDGDSRSAAIDSIDAAIGAVSKEMSSIGDAQSRLSFKEDNLSTAKTNYEASQSRIEDADFAQEQMEIAKLQIRQQTGTASLAQANASSQGVLSLVG